jgi:hypothetical protein
VLQNWVHFLFLKETLQYLAVQEVAPWQWIVGSGGANFRILTTQTVLQVSRQRVIQRYHSVPVHKLQRFIGFYATGVQPEVHWPHAAHRGIISWLNIRTRWWNGKALREGASGLSVGWATSYVGFRFKCWLRYQLCGFAIFRSFLQSLQKNTLE